jgi:hypothetical protein
MAPRSTKKIPADDPKASAGNFERRQRAQPAPARMVPPKVAPPPSEATIQHLIKKTGASRDRVLEEFCERAAIREFVGEMGRAQAEQRAIDDVIAVLAPLEHAQGSLRGLSVKGAHYVPDGENYW